jgi:TPR repeat protein
MERRWMYAVIGTLACAASALADVDLQDIYPRPATPPASSFEAIYARESKENAPETIKAYILVARKGSCQAAKRLGEIYDRALLGVARDLAEGVKWYGAAQVLGCNIPIAQSGSTRPTPRPNAPSLQAAVTLDREGKGAEAVDAYDRAARAGNCDAAKRLGEIYDQGLIGITRNYPESLKWYNAARVLGCEVPMATRK